MIAKSPFGKTAHNSTRTLFGAAALAEVSQADADRTLDLLFRYGINHIDTAASYGEAELRIGPWMPKHRDKFFLATKTEMRTYSGAMKELENSRKRLQSDVIDLWQMHVLVDEEGWQTAMGPDGALKAFIEAKEKGWVRFLGVTGHGVQAPDFHRRSLEVHPFDSVLLPWNFPMSLNENYSRSFNELKKICMEKEIVMQTIKATCRRPWPVGKQNRATWYEPLEEQGDINRAVSYILSDPQLFLNTAGDIDILPRVLQAAADFSEGKITDPSDAEMAAMAEKLTMAPLFHSAD
ncbi:MULTISPECIES: aldo/keto reductase [unclassified Oceanispirochaeta]|uniref:aldo/keto reductase n=1 Tax=unclassified Oceanispirochaeta TaxID=2635722 RepID=UPI000E099B7C|nr:MULTISPECIES: aldo/keto reductase [unclassified Oceanispirochaeta]MBF9015764.1 aldo/keto reductase [Oceanispirochaeta sp. M2]NPD72227.1 aldo/keto reductase [Oceanispirochaeta sp. M1]RDG32325.1 aldo/keto reductase [Oceanispirochaeta sp. M1]